MGVDALCSDLQFFRMVSKVGEGCFCFCWCIFALCHRFAHSTGPIFRDGALQHSFAFSAAAAQCLLQPPLAFSDHPALVRQLHRRLQAHRHPRGMLQGPEQSRARSAGHRVLRRRRCISCPFFLCLPFTNRFPFNQNSN